MAPIADFPLDRDEHTEALHKVFDPDRWSQVKKQYLSLVPMLHMAKFQIIEHLVPGMGQQAPPDRLRSRYLLFICEIDGRADDFYDHLYHLRANQPLLPWAAPAPTEDGQLVGQIWGHCGGFPQPLSPYRFRHFMHRYEISASLVYEGADACLPDILRALAVKELSAAWIATDGETGQSMAKTFALYRQVLTRIASMETHELMVLNHILFKSNDRFSLTTIADRIQRL